VDHHVRSHPDPNDLELGTGQTQERVQTLWTLVSNFYRLWIFVGWKDQGWKGNKLIDPSCFLFPSLSSI